MCWNYSLSLSRRDVLHLATDTGLSRVPRSSTLAPSLYNTHPLSDRQHSPDFLAGTSSACGPLLLFQKPLALLLAKWVVIRLIDSTTLLHIRGMCQSIIHDEALHGFSALHLYIQTSSGLCITFSIYQTRLFPFSSHHGRSISSPARINISTSTSSPPLSMPSTIPNPSGMVPSTHGGSGCESEHKS